MPSVGTPVSSTAGGRVTLQPWLPDVLPHLKNVAITTVGWISYPQKYSVRTASKRLTVNGNPLREAGRNFGEILEIRHE